MVRVRYTIQSAISSTSAEERDLGNTNWQIVTDQEAKGGTWKTVVTAGTSGLQIQIDNISVIQLLIIRIVANNPNQPPNGIVLNFNSPTGPQVLVQPLGDAQEGHMVISTDSVTALYASNPGVTDMAMTVIASGT
jgi:hypothetical protein